MRMPPLKTVCIRGQKLYSHMYATEFRLLKYRISSIIVGSIFSFAQKGGDHASRAITSNIAHGKSCPKYFVLLPHQIKKMTDLKQNSLYSRLKLLLFFAQLYQVILIGSQWSHALISKRSKANRRSAVHTG